MTNHTPSGAHRVRMAIAALAAWTAVAVAAVASTPEARPPEPSASTRALRDRVDHGRYAAAESLGVALLSRTPLQSHADSIEVAGILDLMVEAGWRDRRSKSPSTLERAERAVALKQTLFGDRDPEVARSLENLGIVREEREQFDVAGDLYRRSLRIRLDAFGPAHPDVASSLENLGLLLKEIAEYDSAGVCLARSLAIRERFPDADSLNVARSLNAIGQLDSWQDDFIGARHAYERVLRIRRAAATGPDHPQVAGALNNLATALLDLGEYDEARRDLEEALRIRRSRLGDRHPLVASTQSNLALVHQRQGDFATAIALHEQAIRTAEASGKDDPIVASMLGDYAEALVATGELARAEKALERALRIRTQTLGAKHPSVAATLQDLGVVYRKQGQLETARANLERAAAIQEAALGPGSVQLASTLADLAAVHGAMGATGPGLEAALRSEAIGRKHMQITAQSLSEQQALRYEAVRARGLDLALSLLAAAPDPDAVARVWDAVVHSRALVLDELISRHRCVVASPDSAVRQAALELEAARTRWANLEVREARSGSGALRARIDLAAQDVERAERNLAERSARFRDELERGRIGFDALGARIGARDVLVAYAVYRDAHFETVLHPPSAAVTASRSAAAAPDSSYLAFVLRGDRTPVTAVTLGSARDIDSLAGLWMRRVASAPGPGRAAIAASERACRDAGAALRQHIWDPLHVDAGSTQRVFVVSDGAIQPLNLAALPAAGSDQYWIETGPLLHLVSTERDLLPITTPPPQSRGLLVMGGPDFDASPAGSPGSPQSRPAAVTRGASNPEQRGDLPCDDLAGHRFDALPGARREALEIEALWRRLGREAGSRGEDAVCLVGPQATEGAFRDRAAGYRFLHLATHGFFLHAGCTAATSRTGVRGANTDSLPAAESWSGATLPPLGLSGLAFAGANRGSQSDSTAADGVLTAEEISNLDLQGVATVVVSGCNTGIGVVRVREGVFGLRRAFQVAGARTLVVGLWSLRDDDSRAWMEEFYDARLVRSLGTAEAVHAASLAMLGRQRSRGGTGHPNSWAGFVATGDWR